MEGSTAGAKGGRWWQEGLHELGISWLPTPAGSRYLWVAMLR